MRPPYNYRDKPGRCFEAFPRSCFRSAPTTPITSNITANRSPCGLSTLANCRTTGGASPSSGEILEVRKPRRSPPLAGPESIFQPRQAQTRSSRRMTRPDKLEDRQAAHPVARPLYYSLGRASCRLTAGVVRKSSPKPTSAAPPAGERRVTSLPRAQMVYTCLSRHPRRHAWRLPDDRQPSCYPSTIVIEGNGPIVSTKS